ncbi:hypothetical protein BMS3Abin03_00106 [bacterium BMS3Abin03]|nr:hypothetical protein BMS3Abin03_00106 [bacterium BMS3Abin03]
MRSKLFTTMFALFLLVCFSASFGQGTKSEADANAPFVINPTPDQNNPPAYVPLEEIFGSNQNMYGPGGMRGRGNIFYCTTARKLVEQRFYLNPTAAANMWFVVYEGAAQQGTYNLVHSVNILGQGPGEGWYSSGAIDFDFVPGNYYAIYLQWDVNANYWNENPASPYPIPCSFGELQSGIGWNWAPPYGDPPPATQDVQETFVDPVAYYQTIVTDDIVPVELMSFTFQVNKNAVTLNWQTATEMNNHGFEIQRKTNGEFLTIGFANGYGTTTESHSYTFVDENLSPGQYTYRLKQVDFDGTATYYNELLTEVEPPVEFTLAQNYPNPFNPSTKISFGLATDSKVTLTVYNLLGETVATLVNSNMAAGNHDVIFDAANLNSSVYFYRIEANGVDGSRFTSVRKMILTK